MGFHYVLLRNNDFIFNTEGFNLRNTELAAVLGIEQLKRLNSSSTEL